MRVPVFQIFLNIAALAMCASALSLRSFEMGTYGGTFSVASAMTSWWSWPISSMEDIWKIIADTTDKALQAGNAAIDNVKANQAYHDIIDKLDAFHNNLNYAVGNATLTLDELKHYNVNMTELHERLANSGSKTIENLENEFQKPLPEDMDEKALYRARMVSRALDQIGGAYVVLCTELDMPQDVATRNFERIRPAIEDTLIIAGGVIDRHPDLFRMILITAVFLMAPQINLLRPLFSIFGFGPTGPIKRSAAAWMQRRFWGGAVEAGSWFAVLQRAGMVGKFGAWFSRIFLAVAAWFGTS